MTKQSFIDQHTRRDVRRAIKRANPKFFEPALLYLEDDSRHFGSGYHKEVIWKYIRRYKLTKQHIKRLQKAALKYLERPMSREFKPMCQTMSRIATDDFWEHIRTRLTDKNPIVQINAYCLYAYSEGIEAGERQRLWLTQVKRLMLYRRLMRHHPIFGDTTIPSSDA